MMNDRFNDVEEKLGEYKCVFETHLASFIKRGVGFFPPRLHQSMIYSLNAGGKRLRPSLCLAIADTYSVPQSKVMPLALALEMIHTASLIHDDLPCMDNDSLRRGKPTNHVVFGESLALLAGTSLIIWAFEQVVDQLSTMGVSPLKKLDALALLMSATGPMGIYGGQVLDTDVESQRSRADFVYEIAYSKTAILIRAAVLCGAVLDEKYNEYFSALDAYGTHLGMVFQIVDDILDVTGKVEELGKTPGKDLLEEKRTFVSVYGLEEAKKIAVAESTLAKRALDPLRLESNFLQRLIDYFVERNR